MNEEYYLLLDGAPAGPFTLAQLSSIWARRADDPRIHDQTQVTADNGENWKSIFLIKHQFDEGQKPQVVNTQVSSFGGWAALVFLLIVGVCIAVPYFADPGKPLPGSDIPLTATELRPTMINAEFPVEPTLFSGDHGIQKAAYDLATRQMLKILKAPSTSKFVPFKETHVRSAGDDYSVTGMFDSQNGFGAMIRGSYHAKIKLNRNQMVFKLEEITLWNGSLPD